MYPSLGGHTQKQRTYFLQQQQQKFLAAKLDKSSLDGRERLLGIPTNYKFLVLEMTDNRFQITNALRHGRPGYRFLPTFLKKSGRPQHITKRADYIPKTSEALQPENCLNLVMCEITKAPKMKLQSALKSASAAFFWGDGR